jgi:hypothetical protein
MPFIYSTRFAGGSIASGANTNVYTVPSGMVAIIREIDLGAQNAPANSVAVNITGVGEVFSVDTITQYRTAQWKGRCVVNAGEDISVDAIGGAWSYLISGYLLTI